MISKLIVTEEDLPKLVGKQFLFKLNNEHDLVNNNKKDFILHKRLNTLIISEQCQYALINVHSPDIVSFADPCEMVRLLNSEHEVEGFYSLATPRELKIIHQWLIDDVVSIL